MNGSVDISAKEAEDMMREFEAARFREGKLLLFDALDGLDDELKELHLSMTSDMKRAINEYFESADQGGIAATVASFLLKTVDFLTSILEKFGLT